MQINSSSPRSSLSAAALQLPPQPLARSFEHELDEWVNALGPEEAAAGFSVREELLDWQRRNQGRLPEHSTPLYLSNLQFKSLPTAMVLLQNLRELDLSCNDLEEVPPVVWQLANLTRLELHNNYIERFPADIANLASLESLDLSSNRLTTLPSEIGQLRQLEYLAMRYNHMRELPQSLESLSKLKVMRLNSNPELAHLPDGIVDLARRCELEVEGCPLPAHTLQTLEAHAQERQRALVGGEPLPEEEGAAPEYSPEWFQQRTALHQARERVRLDNALAAWANEIPAQADARTEARTRIIAVFDAGSHGSVSLNLSGLNLTSLPDDVLPHWDFYKLDLDGNSFNAVPPCIWGMNVHLLSIRHNQLEHFPDVPLPPGLFSLRVSHNRLTALPPHIGQHQSLRHLDIEGNATLTQLPQEILDLAGRCRVRAAGCGLPPDLMDRLARAEARRVADPDADSSDDDYDDDAAVQPAPLSTLLCNEPTRLALSRDDGEPIPDADSFFTWLDRMRETADFRTDQAGLEARLGLLIDDLLADAELRKSCFAIAFDALATCGDNVALGLNNMYPVIEVAKVLRPGVTEKDVIKIGVDMFVLDVVTRHGQKKIAELAEEARVNGVQRENPEDVETMLFFQTALRTRLEPVGIRFNLPVQDMRYAGSASVSSEELDAAATQIRQEVQDRQRIVAFLSTWTPLQKFVEKEHAQQFDAVTEKFSADLERMGEEAASSGEESAYLEAAAQMPEAVAKERLALRQKLVDALLQEHFAPAQA